MAIPVSCGPQQDETAPAKKKAKKALRPGNCEEASRPEPVQPPPAATKKKRPAEEAAATDKIRPEPVHAVTARSASPTAKPPDSQATAADPSWKNPTPDGKAGVEGGVPNAASVTADSGGLQSKKRLQQAAAASCKKSGEGEWLEEDPAAADAPDCGEVEPKKRLQAAAATSGKKSGEEEGQEDPAAALAPSDNKERKDEMCVRASGASWVWKFFSRPWLQQRKLEGPDFLWKKTSLLNRLFECCGIVDLIVTEDLRVPHVSEKITLVSEAKGYYKIKGSVAQKLSVFYSSFRVVLGDGECFYRSFIYSYLELILDLDDTFEENRLLCAIEKISSVCVDLEWLYDDFHRHCKAFKELVQKVKSWKTQRREVRRMLLLTYFGDYRGTEAIFSFLRIASAGWILTHPEFSAFLENGTNIEEYCRSEILQSRSYADNIAISALSDALGIQFRIFCLETGHIQDICVTPSNQSNGVPTVSLAYTGIHYDILYPI